MLASGGGDEGQAATDLIKPQPVSVKQAIGDPFHDRLCQGLYDADNVDPWRDLGTFFQYVPWVGKYAATYKSHFYDPDTGRNWWGDTNLTALTRGRSVAAYALDCYLAPGIYPTPGTTWDWRCTTAPTSRRRCTQETSPTSRPTHGAGTASSRGASCS